MERKPTPLWCKTICSNSMNERCVNVCGPRRSAEFFDPPKKLVLKEMPPFPLHEWNTRMTPKERQACVGIYMAKTVDQLQGRGEVLPFWNYATRPRNGG